MACQSMRHPGVRWLKRFVVSERKCVRMQKDRGVHMFPSFARFRNLAFFSPYEAETLYVRKHPVCNRSLTGVTMKSTAHTITLLHRRVFLVCIIKKIKQGAYQEWERKRNLHIIWKWWTNNLDIWSYSLMWTWSGDRHRCAKLCMIQLSSGARNPGTPPLCTASGFGVFYAQQ